VIDTLKSYRPSRPVLDGLSNMRGLNVSRAGQIRNRPGQFEDVVIGAGAQLHLGHGRFD